MIEREINHNKLTYKCTTGEVDDLFNDFGVVGRDYLLICDILENKQLNKYTLEARRKVFEKIDLNVNGRISKRDLAKFFS